VIIALAKYFGTANFDHHTDKTESQSIKAKISSKFISITNRRKVRTQQEVQKSVYTDSGVKLNSGRDQQLILHKCFFALIIVVDVNYQQACA